MYLSKEHTDSQKVEKLNAIVKFIFFFKTSHWHSCISRLDAKTGLVSSAQLISLQLNDIS